MEECCFGYRSCFSATIYSNSGDNSVVSCGTREACQNGLIRNVNTLYLDGVLAFRNGDGYAIKNLYIGGDVPLYDATFYTDGVGVMNVYFIQVFAGSRSTFHCQRGDFCNIFCQTDWSCINTVVNAVWVTMQSIVIIHQVIGDVLLLMMIQAFVHVCKPFI